MKEETLNQGCFILQRLDEIREARRRWEDEGFAGGLMHYLGLFHMGSKVEQVPAPIAAFKRACLDALATEEAVLKAEFEAL